MQKLDATLWIAGKSLGPVAPGLIRASSAAPNRPRVAGVSGTWIETTSDSARSLSNASGGAPSTTPRTRMPKASARRATADPILPIP